MADNYLPEIASTQRNLSSEDCAVEEDRISSALCRRQPEQESTDGVGYTEYRVSCSLTGILGLIT